MSAHFDLYFESGGGERRLERPWQRMRSIRVASCEVPLTFDAFLGGNLSVAEDGGGAVNAAIAAGSYSAASLATALQVALNAISGKAYTATLSETTGRYTISVSAGTVQLFFGASDATLAAMIGISQNTADAASVTGDLPAQPSGLVPYLYLTSNLARIATYPGAQCVAACPVRGAIARVPLDQPAYSWVYWRAPDASPRIRGVDWHSPVQSVSFELIRPDTLEQVDLRGAKFSLTLEVEGDL